jgi:hypothetical protein
MIFTEAEKLIFAYPSPDGSTLYEDPLRLRRELIIASEGEFDAWLKASKTEDAIAALPAEGLRRAEELRQLELESKFVAATRKALGGVPDINFQTGEGFTDAWVLKVLQLFLDWVAEKKARPGSTPTSPPPTGVGPDHSTTPPSSDFT